MDINSYKQGPRTAGISIFHDGLPKLASVHCYDRGNVATFGLQSCQPKPTKHPLECYPLRPIPNHIKPKGPLINEQRMYADPKRPLVNQSKIYSGAFYPPGSQPRLQFVDGRPIIIPSTFENKFISKECFDQTINKSKSIIYNEPHQYSNCCKQYSSLDNPHKYTDDASKRPLNCMPDLPYNSPYMVENEIMRRRMNNQDYNHAKSFPFVDALHRESLLHPSFNPGNSLPIGCEPRNHSLSHRGSNRTAYNRRNPPIVIDLDKISDDEKEVANHRTETSNKRDTVNKLSNKFSDPTSKHNDETISNQKQYHNNDGVSQKKNASSFRCNSCQQEVTLENSRTYIDDSLKTASGYNFTSTLLCNECAKKSRMWDSMRNLSTESLKPREYDNSRNDDNSCNNDKRVNRNEYIPREYLRNKHNIMNRNPVVIDLENPMNEIPQREGNPFNETMANRVNSNMQMSNVKERSTLSPSDNTDDFLNGNPAPTGTPNCAFCNQNAATNDKLFNGDLHSPSLKNTQISPSCEKCITLSRMSIQRNVLGVTNHCMPDQGYNNPEIQKINVSPSYFNSHKDKFLNADKLIEKRIIINVENLLDEEVRTEVIPENCSSSPQVTKNNGDEETISKTDEEKCLTSNNIHSHLRIKPESYPCIPKDITVKAEVNDSDNTTIILHMEHNNSGGNVVDSNTNVTTNSKVETNSDISLELDIDEKSFESFINNAQIDTYLPEYTKTSSTVYSTNRLDNGDKHQQPNINELSRKRKSNCPNLQLSDTIDLNMRGSDHLNEGDNKSNPTSPNYHINEEQLQKFRSKVVPVLKAKKWIRQSSVDNES